MRHKKQELMLMPIKDLNSEKKPGKLSLYLLANIPQLVLVAKELAMKIVLMVQGKVKKAVVLLEVMDIAQYALENAIIQSIKIFQYYGYVRTKKKFSNMKIQKKDIIMQKVNYLKKFCI